MSESIQLHHISDDKPALIIFANRPRGKRIRLHQARFTSVSRLTYFLNTSLEYYGLFCNDGWHAMRRTMMTATLKRPPMKETQ